MRWIIDAGIAGLGTGDHIAVRVDNYSKVKVDTKSSRCGELVEALSKCEVHYSSESVVTSTRDRSSWTWTNKWGKTILDVHRSREWRDISPGWTNSKGDIKYVSSFRAGAW